MNISFVKLEEDCELCYKHTLHMEWHGEVENCEICELFADHKERYDFAQSLYNANNQSPLSVKIFPSIFKKLYCSHGFKVAIFTCCLIKIDYQTHSKNISSSTCPLGITYVKVLNHNRCRDCETVIFRKDNCTAQNKN